MGADQFVSALKRGSQGEANDAADQDRTDKIDYERLVYCTITAVEGQSPQCQDARAPHEQAPTDYAQTPDAQTSANGMVTLDICYMGKLFKWTMADDSTIADLTADLADTLAIDFSNAMLYNAGVRVRANEAVVDYPALSLVEK
jgi:hypothetical protein